MVSMSSLEPGARHHLEEGHHPHRHVGGELSMGNVIRLRPVCYRSDL